MLENQRTNTPSLKYLAEKFLKLEIRKEYQRSDWRIRPLFAEMTDYAATDAQALPYILLSMLEAMPLQTNKGHSIDMLRTM